MTYRLRGSLGYLTREFFEYAIERIPDAIRVAFAIRQNQRIAMSFCLRDATTLYGRYWGTYTKSTVCTLKPVFTNGLRMRSSKGSHDLIPEPRVNIKLHAALDPSKHEACIGLKTRSSRELSNSSCVKSGYILITFFRHVMNTHHLNYPTNPLHI